MANKFILIKSLKVEKSFMIWVYQNNSCIFVSFVKPKFKMVKLINEIQNYKNQILKLVAIINH